MIPVTITCEAEPMEGTPSGAAGFRPVLRLNGEAIWSGDALPGADEAERVALACLRYRLGGLLTGAEMPPPPREGDAADAEPVPIATSVDQLVEGLRREVADGMQRIQDFIDGGEWKRFLP